MWLPILSAFAGIIAFSPYNLHPAAFVFLVPLFLFFLREEKLWRLVMGAFLFRLMFLLGTVYFTLEPLLWISSLCIFLGLPLSVWLIKKLSACLLPTAYCLLFSLPFLWTLFDILQAQFSLFPTYIASAGNALGSSPFLGLANIGGFITLTFFVALVNAVLTAAFLERGNRKIFVSLIVALLVFLFSGWFFSRFVLEKNTLAYDALSNSCRVSVVSTADTFAFASFDGLMNELAGTSSDLVVFPEGTFTGRSPVSFSDVARGLRTQVLAAYDTVSDGNTYNSTTLFNDRGMDTGVHNKNRLTFIGEYWPFGEWQPSFYTWLREKNPDIGTYAIFNPANADHPGERNLLSATCAGNAVSFAAPICLEIHYPSDLKEYRDAGARFIVNQSSNRWIGTGLSHYLYLTGNLKKIEATWLGLPIISSGVRDEAGITLPNGQTLTAPASDKNYSVFFGTVRY